MSNDDNRYWKGRLPRVAIYADMLWLAKELAFLPLDGHLHLRLDELRPSQLAAIDEHAAARRISIVEPEPGDLYILASSEIMEWWTEQTDDKPGDDDRDYPQDLRPHLNRCLSVNEIAFMAFLKGTTIKTKHKAAWGEPDEPAAGSRPARWQLRRILPALQKQFPKLREPPPED